MEGNDLEVGACTVKSLANQSRPADATAARGFGDLRGVNLSQGECAGAPEARRTGPRHSPSGSDSFAHTIHPISSTATAPTTVFPANPQVE